MAPSHGRIAKFVGDRLGEVFRPRVTVGEIRLDPLGPAVTLSNVAIGDGEEPDLSIAKARVDFEVSLPDKARITRIILDEPVLREEAIGRLFRPATPGAPRAEIPPLFLRRGKLLVQLPHVGRFEFHDLAASLTPREGGELGVLGTAKIPLRGSVRVGGNINLVTGALDVRAETETPVDLGAIEHEDISRQIQFWREQFQPRGQLGVFARIVRESENAPLGTVVEVEGSGLSATGPNLEIGGGRLDLRAVAASDFKVTARLDRSGLARLSAEGRLLGSSSFQLLCEGRADPVTRELLDVQCGMRVRELILGPTVQQVLDRIDDGVADVVRGIHPEGPIDLSAGFDFDFRTKSMHLQADVDLASRTNVTFLGFSGTDNRVDASFPYLIESLSGHVSVAPGAVVIAGVRGAMGRGKIAVDGTVTGTGLVGIDVNLRGDGVAIDAPFRDALDGVPHANPELVESLKKDPQWEDPDAKTWKPVGLPDGPATLALFDLQGDLGFDVNIRRPEGRRAADVVVRATSDGRVSGAFRDLPVRVDGLVGSVTFEKGLAQFAFDGVARGARVRIEGAVDGRRNAKGEEPRRNGVRVRVASRGFPLDPALAHYFHGVMHDVEEIIDEIQPSLTCDFEYRGEREMNRDNGILDSFVAIQSREGFVRNVPKIAIQLDQLRSSMLIFARPDASGAMELDVSLDSIRARYFGAPVFASGSFRRKPGVQARVEIRGDGSGLPLSQNLLCDSIKSFSPRATAALRKYQFSGEFDAAVHFRSSAFVNDVRVEVNVQNGFLSGPGLPGPLEHFSGRVVVAKPQDLIFHGRSFFDLVETGEMNAKFERLPFLVGSEELIGRIHGVEALVEDFVIAGDEPSGGVTFSGRVDGAQPIQVFEALELSRPELHDWIARLGLKLAAVPRQLSFELSIPEDGSIELVARGTLEARSGSILSEGIVSGISGVGEIDSLTYGAEGLRASVNVSNARMSLFELPASGFSSAIAIEPESFTLSNTTFRFVGGTVKTSRDAGAARDHFLKIDYSGPEPKWELNPTIEGGNVGDIFKRLPVPNKDVRGTIDLGVLLSGTGTHLRTIDGRGVVHVENANLFEVPIGKAVYDGLKIQQKPMFHLMEGDFKVHDGMINFRRLVLESAPLLLKGDGWIGLDGQVYMTFLPRKVIDDIIIVGPIIRAFQDLLIDVTVYGTIDNPKHKLNTPFSSKVRQEKQVIAPTPPLDLGERF